MGAERGIVDYVCSSVVRTAVLGSIASDPRPTDAVIAAVDASESAVYDALAGLESQGLIRQVDRRSWEPTGTGTAVLAVIGVRDETQAVLDADQAYWRDHDTAVLPGHFRSRLHELAGAEVVRASDTDPHRIVRLVGEELEAADDLDVIAPVYHERYESAIREIAGRVRPRIVVDATTVRDRLAGTVSDEPADIQGVEARVMDIDLALAVTDDRLFLSFPTLDGNYDARTEVMADSAAARRWGRDLFEHFWERATPAETYVKGHPDLVPD